MTDKLDKAFNEVMMQMVWSGLWRRAIDRSNDQAKAMLSNPRPGGKLEGYLSRLNKQMKASIFADWKPIRGTGRPRITKDRVTLSAEAGVADALYMADEDDMQQVVVESVITEMMNDTKWLEDTIKGRMHGGRS